MYPRMTRLVATEQGGGDGGSRGAGGNGNGRMCMAWRVCVGELSNSRDRV
jgi:hypothetical protein